MGKLLNRTERIQFRATRKFKDLVEETADLAGMSTAEFIRACVLDFIHNDPVGLRDKHDTTTQRRS